MGRYKKGLNTCNDIVQTSKRLFYERGYSQTTIQEICNECDITLGNFTYYFKTKQDLLRRIYKDFVSSITDFIDNDINEDLSYLEKFVITSFIYYYNILEDEVSLNFHYKVLKDNSLCEFLSKNLLDDLYAPFASELNLCLNRKELEILYFADFGIRRELTIKHIEDNLFNSSLEFCTNLCKMTARVFNIKDDIILKYLAKDKTLLENLDISKINLLKL